MENDQLKEITNRRSALAADLLTMNKPSSQPTPKSILSSGADREIIIGRFVCEPFETALDATVYIRRVYKETGQRPRSWKEFNGPFAGKYIVEHWIGADNSSTSTKKPTSESGSTVDQNPEEIVASGRIAEVENALKDPDSFIVSHNLLGWALMYLDSDFSTLISELDALKIINRQRAGFHTPPTTTLIAE